MNDIVISNQMLVVQSSFKVQTVTLYWNKYIHSYTADCRSQGRYGGQVETKDDGVLLKVMHNQAVIPLVIMAD